MAMPDLDIGITEADLMVQSNPEAMLDVLTIRSLRTRYADSDVISVASEPLVSLERDLDTFVRDFQIDDSISDIFLFDEEPKKTKTKQTLLGSASSKHTKKVGRRSQSVDNILEATESGSTSSKKPKTFSSLFSRKAKPKPESRKAKAVTWHSQTHNVPVATLPTSKGGHSGNCKLDDADGGYMTMNKSTSRRVGLKSQRTIESKRGLLNRSRTSPDADGEYAILHTVCTDNSKFDELVSHIENGNTHGLIHDLSTLPPDVTTDLCDLRGNNVLHKCVLKNKTSLIPTIISIHPHLADHMNKEEITPVELAIKLGRTACVKTLMEKCLPQASETSVAHISDLLTFALLCRQDKVAGIVLDHLATLSSGSPRSLPARGKRGLPSHVAAERDDINCLQRLVELGFDVTAATSHPSPPVSIAYNKDSKTSFRYLLLLHVLESVLKETLCLTNKYSCACMAEEDAKRNHQLMLEKLIFLEKAHKQCQALVDKQHSSVMQCIDLVEKMMDDTENRQQSDELNELKQLLMSMTSHSTAVADMSYHINELDTMLRSRSSPVPLPDDVTVDEARHLTRNLLKEVHSSWTSPNSDIDDLVKTAVSSQTQTSRRTRQQTRSNMRLSDHPSSGADGCSKEISDTSSRYDRLWKERLLVDVRDRRAVQRTMPENKLKNAKRDKTEVKNPVETKSPSMHSMIQPKVSHEYEVLDKGSPGLQNNAAKKMFERQRNPEMCATPEIHKIPVVSKKSPDYATISSDIGENINHQNIDPLLSDDHSDFSDEDTMSTISSHNSTLQSAVGHLSQGCLSDTDDSCDRGNMPVIRRYNVTDNFISQLDVSDFSGDNSSDWWSVSKCTSCLSHMTSSQMTSYCSEDDYENECYNYVRLNLENEDLPDELLRNHRLCRHLEAVGRLNTENKDIIETVVTASGERIESGSSHGETRYINISSSSESDISSHAAPSVVGKEKKRSRVKLFNPCELVSKRELSQSDFLECYDRSADVIHTHRCHNDLDLPWDQLQFSDAEEDNTKDKPWYDVSEDEESLTHAWSSESDTSTICNSSEE